MSEPVNSEQDAATPKRDGAADAVCCWLIRRAARGTPGPLAERLEEEWRADLAERPSALSKLRFALGCCWATWVIALEQRPLRARVTSGVTVGGMVTGLWSGGSRLFADRSTAFVVVVFIHIALFYGLMSGLAMHLVKAMPGPIQTKFLDVPREREKLPPMQPPTFKPTQLNITPPEFPTTSEPADETVIRETPTAAQPAPPQSPSHVVNRVSGGPGTGFPNADDFYPLMAKRLEEQGVSAVHVCVDALGRLKEAPTVAQSSGSARLDEGAISLAKAGSGHYRPSLEDGKAVASCYSFRVRFQLRN